MSMSIEVLMVVAERSKNANQTVSQYCLIIYGINLLTASEQFALMFLLVFVEPRIFNF